MCLLQVEIKSAAFVSVLLADTHSQTKQLTVMHAAHGERKKVFPVLPVFLTSEHVTDQRVKNTPPPPLQPIDSSTLHKKRADLRPVGFSVLLPTLLGLVD